LVSEDKEQPSNNPDEFDASSDLGKTSLVIEERGL
jgi:hypothetical protein